MKKGIKAAVEGNIVIKTGVNMKRIETYIFKY